MSQKIELVSAELAEAKPKSDWPWVASWSLVALALASLPFAWGYLATPPGGHFMGLVFNAPDANSYLAKMAQGARGAWQFSLVYTAEEHQGEYVYVFYILLGKLQSLTGLPGIVVYHTARLGFGLLMLLVGYRFICRYFSATAQRRTAFLLLSFSGGLGWLVGPLGLADSTDLWVAESLTFFSLLANPHYPLATALFWLTILWTQDGWEGSGRRAYGQAAVSGFVLGFVHPFMLVPLAGVLGGFVLLDALRTRHIAWASWMGTAVVGLLSAIGPIYTYAVMNANPFMRAWLGQNQTLSPPPWAYLTGYGLLLIAAGAGFTHRATRRAEIHPPGRSSPKASALDIGHSTLDKISGRWRLLGVWVVVQAGLLYLPVGLQRRFVEGLHLPIVCLATAGLYYGWKLRPPWVGRFALATLLSTGLLLAIQVSNLYARPDPASIHPLYLYNEEVTAMEWLRVNTSWRDTVIAGPLLGNYVPTRAGNRVFYGHDLETVNRAAKALLLGRFLRGEMAQSEQDEFIRQNGLHYLYYGPAELALSEAKFDPAAQGWPLVYANSQVRIFRLQTAS